MTRPRTIEMDLEIPSGVVSREGCYVCGRCHHVVHPSQREIDLAESMPAARVMLKCPGCHHQTVEWHPPTIERAQAPRDQQGQRILAPVSPERGKARFAELRAALGMGPTS